MKKGSAGDEEDGQEASNHDGPQLRRRIRGKQAPTGPPFMYVKGAVWRTFRFQVFVKPYTVADRVRITPYGPFLRLPQIHRP